MTPSLPPPPSPLERAWVLHQRAREALWEATALAVDDPGLGALEVQLEGRSVPYVEAIAAARTVLALSLLTLDRMLDAEKGRAHGR